MSIRQTQPGTSQIPTKKNGRQFGLLWMTTWTTLRSSFRSAEFAVGAVAIPVMLYAMIGLPNASNLLPAGSRVGAAMLVSLSAYGVVSLAIFTFGENVAKERSRGWTRTMLATPFPIRIHLAGKSLAAAAHAALIVVAMGLLATTLGGVDETALTWLTFLTVTVAGVVTFSTLGFAIAYVAKPRAAVVISNMIFLPLAFASGFFMPLSELPEVVSKVANYLPTFHFGQIAYRVFMPETDIVAWTGMEARPVWVHLVWVLGSATVFATAALWAARREAVSQRG